MNSENFLMLPKEGYGYRLMFDYLVWVWDDRPPTRKKNFGGNSNSNGNGNIVRVRYTMRCDTQVQIKTTRGFLTHLPHS